MPVIQLVLTFYGDAEAALFFEQNKYRLRGAGLDYCTVISSVSDVDGVRREIECMLVGNHPEFEATSDHVQWAKSDPAPWWRFSDDPEVS